MSPYNFTYLSKLISILRIGFLPSISLFVLGFANNTHAQVSPTAKTDDYITVGCEEIWLPDNPVMLENQTYWLRAIDCSARLSAASTRSIAKNFPDTNWVNSLKKVILLDASNPSLTERKRMIELLNRYRAEFPTTLRPLLQIMRRQQELELSVEEEIARYERLEQFSNTEIAALREERDRIHLQLEETQLKLENIADIERQMSLRRQQQQQIDTVLDNTGSNLQNTEIQSAQEYTDQEYTDSVDIEDVSSSVTTTTGTTVITDPRQHLQLLNTSTDPLYFQLVSHKTPTVEFMLKLSALNKYQMLKQTYSPQAERVISGAESRMLPFDGMVFSHY